MEHRYELAALLGRKDSNWLTYRDGGENEAYPLGKGEAGLERALETGKPIIVNPAAPWYVVIDADDDAGVLASYQLLDHLGSNHLRHVFGPSGGRTQAGRDRLHLWILAESPEARDEVLAAAAKCGIAPKHIRSAMRLPLEAHRSGRQPEWQFSRENVIEILTPETSRTELQRRFAAEMKAASPLKVKRTRKPSSVRSLNPGSITDAALNRMLSNAAGEGERHHSLYVAALRSGSLVAANKLTESEARGHLWAYAAHVGLPDGEAGRTIDDGMARGLTDPDKGGNPEAANVVYRIGLMLDAVAATPSSSRRDDVSKSILKGFAIMACAAGTLELTDSLRDLAKITGTSHAALGRIAKDKTSLFRQWVDYMPVRPGQPSTSSSWIIWAPEATAPADAPVNRPESSLEHHLVDVLAPSSNVWKGKPVEAKRTVIAVRDAGKAKRSVRAGSLRPALRAAAEALALDGGWMTKVDLTEARTTKRTDHAYRQTSLFARELVEKGLAEEKVDDMGRKLWMWIGDLADARQLHEDGFVADQHGRRFDPEARRRDRMTEQQERFKVRVQASRDEQPSEAVMYGDTLVDPRTGEVIGTVPSTEYASTEEWDSLLGWIEDEPSWVDAQRFVAA